MNTSASTIAPRDYVPGLAAVRVLGALLVVVLHAAIPYAYGPMPGLVWPIGHQDASPVTDAIFWSIEGFIMPLFFLIAGYCAAQLLVNSSPRAFLVHRTKRVLLPLIAGFMTILPVCLYIWVLGWVAEGRYAPRKLVSLKFDATDTGNLWSFAHLWFLEYLFLYCLGMFGLAWWRERGKRPIEEATPLTGLRTLLTRAWSPLLLAILAAAILWCDQQIVIGYRSGMIPSPCKFLYYALFFSVGTLVHRLRPTSFPTMRTSVVYLALGSALFTGMLPLIRQSQAGEQGAFGHLAFAVLTGLYAWLMTLGLTGWFIRSTQRQTLAISYLADSSYWVYLLHLPFVTLAQVALMHVPVPAWIKLTAATLATLVMTLGSYQVFVRHTWLGAWLNGRRVPRADEVIRDTVLPPSESRRAA